MVMKGLFTTWKTIIQSNYQTYYLSNQIKISRQYAIISYLFAASAAYGAALKIWKYICCLFQIVIYEHI